MKKETIYTQEFAAQFKQNYSKKMGGTQTIVMPNGQRFDFNDKQYYEGRGKKYNSPSMHDEKGDVIVTKKQVAGINEILRNRKKAILLRKKEQKASIARQNEAKLNGVYPILKKEYGTFIELSETETEGKFFDENRLAKTLDISVEDAKLLKSRGKTYVFAENSKGEIVSLYHAHLSCNSLNISFDIVTKEFVEQFAKDWGFNDLQPNHFVC